MNLDVDEIVALVGSKQTPLLIAIDGFPASGKSTLAERLVSEFSAGGLWLDDFLKPPQDWSSNEPSYPFKYMRYEAFMKAVRELASDHICSFYPYDWKEGRISDELKTIRWEGIAVVEGVSALHMKLSPLYDLRIWVESDSATTLQACIARSGGMWAAEWTIMFLPSVELYLATAPQNRADVFVNGRGFAQRLSRNGGAMIVDDRAPV